MKGIAHYNQAAQQRARTWATYKEREMEKTLPVFRLLAISGSLRVVSSNTALLRAAAALAPDGMEIHVYGGLGDLPHFNPDLEGAEPLVVKEFGALVREADGLI